MKSVALGLISTVALTGALAAPATAASAAVPSTVGSSPSRPAVDPLPDTDEAAAPKAPGVSTTRLIIRAVHDAPETDAVPDAEYTVTRVRVAKVDRSWAGAEVTPNKGVELDPADVVLHRTEGTWRVVDLGTAEVGCGKAPAKVLSSLGLPCG